jgi:hypothetical protein
MNQPPIHVSGGEAHAHPHATGRPRLDLIIAVSAIFISALSLFVAIEHGKTERDLVAASSWPFVQQLLDNGYGAEKDVAMGVTNGGVGPAKIKSLEIFYDGAPVASDLDLLRRCCGLRNETIKSQLPPGGIIRSVIDETVLRPGEDNTVLRIRRQKDGSAVSERFAGSLLHITFRACYCSVLDACWRGDLRSTRTQPVRACPAPEHRFDPLGP